MYRIGIKNIFNHELNQTKRKNIKKIIKTVFNLELVKRFLNAILPSSQKSKVPKNKNPKCTGHRK